MDVRRIPLLNRLWPTQWVSIIVMVLTVASAHAVPSVSAEDSLRALYKELIETLELRKADIMDKPDLLNQLAEEMVVPHIDFLRMSKIVLGKYWRQLSRDDQKRYTEFMRTKISNAMIKLYDPEKSFDLRFVGSRQSPDGSKSLVQTRWQSGENGQIYAVNYRLRAHEDRWRVYDVSVDGISVLQSYKSAVADEIEAGSLAQYMASLDKGGPIRSASSSSSGPR